MLKKSVVMLVLLAVALGLGCGSKGKTLVTVNGTAITEGDLDFLSTMNPRLKVQLATPFGRKQILDNVVDQELLYQAATKKGIQRDPNAKAKIELYKKVIIAQTLVENEMRDAAKEYYDKNKGEFERLQMSDILVKFGEPKKDEKNKKEAVRSKDAALKLANDIKARLDKGEEFAVVAKEVSEDQITKNNGGDMGKVSKNDQRMERRGYLPLVEKAYTMQVGEIAGPIETTDGYHIITVTKGAELEPFEEAEQGIMMKIAGDERNKLMAELKKNAKIVYPGEEKKEAPKPAVEGQPVEKAPEANGGAAVDEKAPAQEAPKAEPKKIHLKLPQMNKPAEKK